jgi:hypothetical protein
MYKTFDDFESQKAFLTDTRLLLGTSWSDLSITLSVNHRILKRLIANETSKDYKKITPVILGKFETIRTEYFEIQHLNQLKSKWE